MSNVAASTPKSYARERRKPEKPSADFPLYAHASGKWAKKIQGKLHYFGSWDDPDAALEAYLTRFPVEEKPLTLDQAVELFLAAKHQAVELNELTARSLREYERTCGRLTDLIGGGRALASLSPADFDRFRVSRAATCNAVSVGNEVTRVKTMLKWLIDMGHCPKVETGPTFRKPPAKVMRRIRRENGKKMFTADEVMRIADEAGESDETNQSGFTVCVGDPELKLGLAYRSRAYCTEEECQLSVIN